ncbi:uncharacterized protein [Primulina eburnea]|uniref:uncharacterized protein n=1 Tax=Primulina eburnea TaxID=1245227 RepID=UPI003C6CB221
MNKPPFKRGATVSQPNMATTEEEKFDPIKEFSDDPAAYEIHYYNNAIFALKGSKEELKYPYLISGCLNCCHVDKDLKGLSPIHIAQSYLIKDLQPILGRKTRDYFETILVETGSVEIQHMDRNRDFAFSKMIIKKIIPAANWGLPLGQARQLNTFQAMPNMFNYHDYIMAWDTTLIYESSQRKHSWWIKFQLYDIHQFIPTWFKTFFFSWGVMPSILPRNVKNIWIKFQQANIQFDGLTAMIQFAINYNIPWIIRWEYGLQEMVKEKFEIKFARTILIRKILIKWWGKETSSQKEKFYDRRGVIALGPARETMKNLNHDISYQTTLLKEIFQHLDKNTITFMFSEVFGEKSNLSTQASTSTSSKGKEKTEDDTPMKDQDNPEQDAQDPYDGDDDIFALLNA